MEGKESSGIGGLSTASLVRRGFDLVVQGELAIVLLCWDDFAPLSMQLLLTLLILLMTSL